MNIEINLNNAIINKSFLNQLYSVKIKIIHEKDIYEIKGIFNETKINIKTNILFENNQKYTIIVSVVSLGIQISKRKYTFIYHKDDQYKLDNNCSIINNDKTNKIDIINSVSDKNYSTLRYKVNPLCAFRDEENKFSIYLNGNIYLISGNLLNMFKNMLELKEFSNITNEQISNINTLIKKGCIIAYEG